MIFHGEHSFEANGEEEHIAADAVRQHLFGQFKRAFVVDGMADIEDSAYVNNGRFTYQVDDDESPMDDMWRICLRSPEGRSQGYRARAYLHLTSEYNPRVDDEVDVDGVLFVEERVRRVWLPVVMIDSIGATVVDADDILRSTADGFLEKDRQDLNAKRIAQLFRRLMRSNIEATNY